MKYAIVQHSGWGYASDYQFIRGLETRAVETKAQVAKVEAAGGLVFDDYNEAEDFCDLEMYPGTYMGLIPQAPGSFSSKKIDGLAIYVPRKRAEVVA